MTINRFLMSASLPVFMSGACLADFSGSYAPDQWTFSPGIGGVLVEHSASTLVFHNGDTGLGHTTEITLAAVATGMWSFDWTVTALCCDTGYAEQAYYLINEQQFFLHTTQLGGSTSGSVSVPVNAGDIIGYRISSLKGIFGFATMTVTDFSAPLPAPVASLLLLGFGLQPSRQRQGDSA